MPTYTIKTNQLRRYDETTLLEWWLLILSSPDPLDDDQLITIACNMGLTWWTDAAEGAVYRNTPCFRQHGHRLLVKQRFGLNV